MHHLVINMAQSMQDARLREVQLQSSVSNMEIVLMTGYSCYSSSLVVVYSAWAHFLCASTPPDSAAPSPVAAERGTHRPLPPHVGVPVTLYRGHDVGPDPPARLGPHCCPPRQWASPYRPAAPESRRAAVAEEFARVSRVSRRTLPPEPAETYSSTWSSSTVRVYLSSERSWS